MSNTAVLGNPQFRDMINVTPWPGDRVVKFKGSAAKREPSNQVCRTIRLATWFSLHFDT